MKVLFWIPPWAANGDPVFYRNSLKKHLALQANLLGLNGWDIDFVLPEFLNSERSCLDQKINLINFSIADQIATFGSISDPSVDLYKFGQGKTYDREIINLSTKLRTSYDIILLWETPVPFLEIMYPDALIIHQMPGAFSRAPYPHTVTFDPVGLYKHGSIFSLANDIQELPASPENTEITKNFTYRVHEAINTLQPFKRSSLNFKDRFDNLVLLPLQVSSHYAFRADTKYKNQTEFLLDVLNKVSPQTGVVVTQYLTPRVSDTVLNKEILPVLKNSYPNLIFREEFDRISSVSQYLLPLVDEVITCSSSIGLQALAWARKLTVFEDTFLHPFATPATTIENIDEFERSSRILSFLLNHNQPLFSSVVKDKEFLTGLLLEMLQRKRSGKKGFNLIPTFSEIDSEYSRKILESFTLDRAERELVQLSENWAPRQAEISKFRKSIFDSEITAVTFDIFDTLIKRPTEVPTDVYKFLESKALEITNGLAEDFARVRVNAELHARQHSQNKEITLDEIYSGIKDHYGLSEGTVESLMEAEIEIELQFVQPRPFGQKCWEIAVSSNKPIYLISDMYLPIEVIGQMLKKVGYEGYKKIFLSSDYLLRKKEGDLFDVVLLEIKKLPFQVVHVGDNKVADIEQAQARGIKTFRLLRAIDRMRGNDYYKMIYPPRLGHGERARSSIAGLIANTLFDLPSGPNEKISHFHGNPHHLGYAGLGPLLTGFMLWLGKEAKRDGITHLYFLSREGWILKQLYDVLHSTNTDAIPSTYLYASRRATRVASLRCQGDILALSGHPYKAGITVGELLHSRFGLAETNEVTAVMINCGYSNWTVKLDADSSSRINFSKLCGQLASQILEVAESERKCYWDYLKQVGFVDSKNPGIVDVGWKGTMQDALSNLIDHPIHGYYYATLQGAESLITKRNVTRGYMGVLLANSHPSTVIANRALFEYLTCHVEPSLIRMERSGNRVIPVFRSETNYGFRRQFIEEVHRGCIQFAKDFKFEFKNFKEQIYIDPFLGERVLSSFITSPSKVDAALLIGHYFEDAFGGNNRQYIIHPKVNRTVRDSIWKEGYDIVYESVDSDKSSIKSNATGKFSKSSILDTKNLNQVSHRFEDIAIRLLTNQRKYEKYKRNRDIFFKDSRSGIVRKWYQWFK